MKIARLAIILALFISVDALAAVSVVMIDKSPQQLIDEVPNRMPISSVEAVSREDIRKVELRRKAKSGKQMLLVGGERSFLVSINSADVIAFPVKLNSLEPIKKLRIEGYLIKPESSGKYVMFPVATALAADGTILETLSPTAESRSKGNAIRNVFLVPEGTRYLLLHGLPEIDGAEVAASADESSPGKALAALGGVVGGVVFGAMQNFQVQRGEIELSPVGVVEIFLESA